MIRRLVVLLACALGAKAAVLAQLGNHPLLQPYGDIDGGVYARLARRIAQGDVLLRGEGPLPYFVSPLYAYFLAATGVSFPVARVVQILLGTAAVALVFLTARRLFGERAALLAGILYALTGVVTFHEVLILQAALDPFLTALALFLLADALIHGSISSKVNGAGAGRWLATGAAFGLLALNRPNVLLCLAATALALAVFTFKEISLRTFLPALALLAGAALTIAPFTLRNLLVSREFVLISSHGGLNFLVGNGPGANGVYRTISGITPDIGGQARDSKKVAEAAEGHPLSSREVSSYFARKAWDWIRVSPGAAVSLFLRKTRILLSGDEAPLNFSFPWYRERSSALKFLWLGPGLLVPLAGAGFVLALFGSAGGARRALLIWAAFVPAYIFAVAAFFVATRYRLPLLVALSPLAGAAAEWFPAAWRLKGRPLALAAGAAAILAVVSLWPTGLWDGAEDEDMHWALYL
ncbi:MAG: glycosyltransferase family 39 protein, partial [Thermoanaerobaculia bacterium]